MFRDILVKSALGALLVVPSIAARSDEVAHHPVPKEPLFLDVAWYPSLKRQLTPPPPSGSAGQASDESELYALQRSRSEADCVRARREVYVSLGNFFGAPSGPLDEATVKTWSPFFERVRNDADFFIQKLKIDFPRQRPFLYLEDLEPCVAREVTGAYPSGHAVLSALFAEILADLEPEVREVYAAIAQEIAHGRVLAGMHHRSDVLEGAKIGRLIYAELKKSKRYEDAFKEAKCASSPAIHGVTRMPAPPWAAPGSIHATGL